MPVAIKSTGGGSVTLTAPSTASDLTLTLPSATGTVATTTGTLTNPTINGFTGDTSVINVGSGQFYKDTSGNVGIGTSSPVGRLGVVNTGGNSQISIGDTAVSSYSTLRMYGGSGHYNFQLGVQNNVSNAFEITPSTAAGGTTFSTPAMVVDSSGNVGIGTSSPSSKLSVGGNPPASGTIAGVASSGGTSLALSDNVTNSLYIRHLSGGATLCTDTGGALAFATNGNTERARIDTSGKFILSSAGQGIQFADGTNQVSASAVKQIVSVSKTDTFSAASSSFTDITGLSASITPTSASSRIFIIVNTMTSSTSADAVSIRIFRNNTTAVGVATGSSNRPASLSVNGFWSNSATSLSGSFVDSPASTSTQTYAIQGRIQTGTFYLNRTANDSDNGVYPRGISTITLMEIV